MGYVYMITCLKNNMSYIGVCVHKPEKRRIDVHLGGKGNKPLANAVKLYGQDAFTYKILESDVFPELLSDLEKFYIDKYNTVEPNGFNQTHGGLHKNWRHSDATRRRMSEWQSANHPMRGRKHSEESKRRMSESRTGQKRSEQARQNISKSLMGHEISAETRSKIGNANRGRKWSDEHRQAMSERNSGEGNPMYGRNRRLNEEYIQKVSGDNSPMALPEKKSVHDYFDSLPVGIPLKEKRILLYAKFPDVKHSTIQHWTRTWIREANSHATTDERVLPEKTSAHDFFFSLPSNMDLKEKRRRLYDAFPTVKNGTLGEWIRKWTNYKPYKEGSLRSVEYHQAHELFLSLSPEMSVVEKRQHLHENVDGVPRSTISRWVKQWVDASGRQPRHPDYERSHKYFLSLPSDIDLKEKRRLLYMKFPNVTQQTIIKWVKSWTGETMPIGAPCHSDRPQVHDYFLSLPLNMPISEKRKRILEKFGGVVGRALVNRWTHRWHIEITGSPPPALRWYREPLNHWKKGKPAHNRRPEYDDARDFFLSLPTMMPLKEKSRQLSEKYQHIPKGTVYQWTSRWQSSS